MWARGRALSRFNGFFSSGGKPGKPLKRLITLVSFDCTWLKPGVNATESWLPYSLSLTE